MLAKTMTHRQRYWLKHVKAADVSDSTIAEYAAAHDVSLKGLYQWKTKLMKLKLYQPANLPPASDFVPVKPSPAQVPLMPDQSVQTNRTGCTVTLPNGARVDFHGELTPGVIRSIMGNVSQAH